MRDSHRQTFAANQNALLSYHRLRFFAVCEIGHESKPLFSGRPSTHLLYAKSYLGGSLTSVSICIVIQWGCFKSLKLHQTMGRTLILGSIL